MAKIGGFGSWRLVEIGGFLGLDWCSMVIFVLAWFDGDSDGGVLAWF